MAYLCFRCVPAVVRVLVVGANGLLGSNVVTEAVDRGWTVHATVRSTALSAPVPLSRVDLREPRDVTGLLDEWSPDVVVNCAAMTDVDACERNPERAETVNGEAPGVIASACLDRDVRFVHVSTDYVFDGRARTPYEESADPNPVQAYGESKLAGERAVRASDARSVVARLSFVYGTHGFTRDLAGFPAWVRDRLADSESVPLFEDQHVSPSRAGQAAATLLDLVERRERGTFHVASRSCLTPFVFGELIAERIGAPRALLEAGALTTLDRDATRPRYTCLDVSNLESTLGRPQPTADEDLAAIDGAFGT